MSAIGISVDSINFEPFSASVTLNPDPTDIKQQIDKSADRTTNQLTDHTKRKSN